jgi:hypothetical protein
MKSLCTHKLHTNLPNTGNELVHKAIITASTQKDAWGSSVYNIVSAII